MFTWFKTLKLHTQADAQLLGHKFAEEMAKVSNLNQTDFNIDVERDMDGETLYSIDIRYVGENNAIGISVSGTDYDEDTVTVEYNPRGGSDVITQTFSVIYHENAVKAFGFMCGIIEDIQADIRNRVGLDV